MTRRRMVIDSHVHFWDAESLAYPWLGAVPELERVYRPDDYPPFALDTETDSAASASTVDAVIFVEANCAPELNEAEVARVEALANDEPRIAATVAFVDLLDTPRRSTSLERFADIPRVVGVRHNIQGNPGGFAVQDAFVQGVQEVGRQGFTFDLCAVASQLTEVIELVRRCPGTSFVLDHCGKPAIGDGALDSWAADLVKLAAHDNISCKLSGLFTQARPGLCSDDVLRPFAERVVECFGPARMLYGSDWPVCTLAGGVDAWRGFTDRFTATWSVDEREQFYAGNAIRTYGLNVDG